MWVPWWQSLPTLYAPKGRQASANSRPHPTGPGRYQLERPLEALTIHGPPLNKEEQGLKSPGASSHQGQIGQECAHVGRSAERGCPGGV